MKKIIATLIIISLLGVPSFVEAKGEDTMADAGWTKMETTNKKKTVTNPNVVKNSVFMYNDKGQPATVSSDAADKYKALGWTVRDDISYGSNGMPYIGSSKESAPPIDYQALFEAQLAAKTAGLQKQRDSALSGLDTEQTNLTSDMYGKRNEVGAQSDIGKMNFAQFMASRGVAGNAGAMPEIYANNALQGNIGRLKAQEAHGNAQIQSNRTNVNSAYQSDLVAAQNQTQADKLQAQINQQNADKVAALEQQRYNTQTNTAADVTAYSRLQDTKSEYANTVGQFGTDYQAEYDKVKNDGDPSNDWQLSVLAAARQQKMSELDEIKKAEATATAKATEAKQKETVSNALQIFGQLGYITPQMAEILQSYGLPTDIVSLNKLKAQSGGSSGGGSTWYLQ